jgi:hypothetical protein
MSGQIFISYRREESRWSARSLFDRLAAHFDRKHIFMDIDAIALGEDFVKVIERTVTECDVLIAVIGARWLTCTDEHNDRRLDNPEDFVRREITTALKRDIRVIPVLVDGALMPRSNELPEDLKPLVRRNALQVSDTRFDDDCRRLTAAIEQVLQKTTSERHERQPKERLGTEVRQKEYLEAKSRVEQRKGPSVDQPPLPPQVPVAPSPAPAKRDRHRMAGILTSLVLVVGLTIAAAIYFGSHSQVTLDSDSRATARGATKQTNVEHVKIAGRWLDEAGSLYTIDQNGDDFTFQASNPQLGVRSQGQGRIVGKQVTSNFQITTPTGSWAYGTGRGWVKDDGTMVGTFNDPYYGEYSHTLTRAD